MAIYKCPYPECEIEFTASSLDTSSRDKSNKVCPCGKTEIRFVRNKGRGKKIGGQYILASDPPVVTPMAQRTSPVELESKHPLPQKKESLNLDSLLSRGDDEDQFPILKSDPGEIPEVWITGFVKRPEEGVKTRFTYTVKYKGVLHSGIIYCPGCYGILTDNRYMGMVYGSQELQCNNTACRARVTLEYSSSPIENVNPT